MDGKAAVGATDAEALARRASLFIAATISGLPALKARSECDLHINASKQTQRVCAREKLIFKSLR